MFRRDIDRPDIQAFTYTGFGSLSGAAYLFLRVVDAPSARGFLGGLRIASIEDLEQAKLAEAPQCARQGDMGRRRSRAACAPHAVLPPGTHRRPRARDLRGGRTERFLRH